MVEGISPGERNKACSESFMRLLTLIPESANGFEKMGGVGSPN